MSYISNPNVVRGAIANRWGRVVAIGTLGFGLIACNRTPPEPDNDYGRPNVQPVEPAPPMVDPVEVNLSAREAGTTSTTELGGKQNDPVIGRPQSTTDPKSGAGGLNGRARGGIDERNPSLKEPVQTESPAGGAPVPKP